MTDCEVLIVGAGITGATLALALADAGVAVTLLDREAAAVAAGAGTAARRARQRHPRRGRRPARAPGRLAAVACGLPGAVRPHRGVGRRFGGQHRLRQRRNRPAVAGLRSSRTGPWWRRCTRAWRELPAARVLAPAVLDDWEVRADRAIVRLGDGRELTARLLVGADGAASPLRLRAGIGAAADDFGQCALVCHVATERPHADTARQRFLPTGPLAFLPLADGRCSIVWSTTPPEAQRLAALPAGEFALELGRAFEHRLGADHGHRRAGRHPAARAGSGPLCRPAAGADRRRGARGASDGRPGRQSGHRRRGGAGARGDRRPAQRARSGARSRRCVPTSGRGAARICRWCTPSSACTGCSRPVRRRCAPCAARGCWRWTGRRPLKRLLTTAACGLADGAFG